jgi:hypothetical protein
LEVGRFGEKAAGAPEHGGGQHEKARLPELAGRSQFIAANSMEIVRQNSTSSLSSNIAHFRFG